MPGVRSRRGSALIAMIRADVSSDCDGVFDLCNCDRVISLLIAVSVWLPKTRDCLDPAGKLVPALTTKSLPHTGRIAIR
jgi:hypothetical protein